MTIKEKKSIREQEKKHLHRKIFQKRRTTFEIFCKDKDFKELRKTYDKSLALKFGEAYTNYIKGDWATAEDLFAQCLKINPNDGPTKTLKGYIEDLNGIRPANWKGFRELTDK